MLQEKPRDFWITTSALLMAFFLSVVSWFNLCDDQCKNVHVYRLYGFSFEAIGITTLTFLIVIHIFSLKNQTLIYLRNGVLCATLGAEAMFIYVQKFMIGSFCPICLSIALSLLIASLPFMYNYLQNLYSHKKRLTMFSFYKGFSGFLFFIIGFSVACFGVGKENSLEAAETSIKEKILFGNSKTPIQVLIFTDWACPGCRSLEPLIETVMPKILLSAQVTFIDDPIHEETLNYTPYNLSFMVYNKPLYLELRKKLTKLSEETKSPTEEQIKDLAKNLKIKYHPLNYSEITLANKYFAELIDQFNIEGTPTLIVMNVDTKKVKKLEGVSEINEESLMGAIKLLTSEESHLNE